MHRLFFVLITLFSTQAFSAEVDNLYQSHFAVSDQSEQQRQLVAPEILRQTILKVVGDRSALDLADLSSILADTENMIQQYQYRRVNEISDDLTQPDELEVLLTFDEAALNRKLIQNRLPVWGKSRPDVLLWMAVQTENNQSIIADDQYNTSLKKALTNASDMRGLPILFPAMDLTDQTLVRFSSLWAGQTDSALTASQRYAAQVIVFANATILNNGQAQISWQSHINGSVEQWQSRGDMASAIRRGVDELTDRLARRFTQVLVANTSSNDYSVKVSNINDFSDYARVTNYLEDLQYVSSVDVSAIESDSVSLTVSIVGDLAVFERTLAVGNVLRKDTFSVSSDDALPYRLVP